MVNAIKKLFSRKTENTAQTVLSEKASVIGRLKKQALRVEIPQEDEINWPAQRQNRSLACSGGVWGKVSQNDRQAYIGAQQAQIIRATGVNYNWS